MMKLTVLYDNETLREDLKANWGFSCLIEANNSVILFDAGFKGSILLYNMEKLNVNPKSIEKIVISHLHLDHVGGLPEILRLKPNVKIYLPSSSRFNLEGFEVFKVRELTKISENVFSTGEISGIEQSVILETGKGFVLVTGCSHPGLEKILNSVSKLGKIYGVIGGFHNFSKLDVLEGIEVVCPCHCTANKRVIMKTYPKSYVKCGVGRIFKFP